VRLARDRRPVGAPREHDEARPERASSPAEAVLALQRSAGNRAVGALLARAPEEGAVAEPEAASKDAGARCTISGIGTMELASYSAGPEFGGTGRTGGPPPPLLISATTKQGKHTPKLMEAVANATRHSVELVDRGMTWAGKEGLLLSYQSVDNAPGGEPHEAWALRIDVPAPKPGA
jgi:hypothetical protein